ncbi:hypothetical protein CVT26_010859 [Gymnopilus dilepis]|uniref:Uncharacterized protein n=1 Tax=Gymnopilus dilepis TaxID=231916 RepID=A0A409W5B3_9AGAR|nr:hypothetical protein CVT26_010859 [Gymnopilus dilepis]
MPFGHDPNRSAVSPLSELDKCYYTKQDSQIKQLLEILGIPKESDLADELQDTLRSIGRTYLDLQLTAAGQKKGLHLIRAQLEKEYPDLFDKDEKEVKLYYAMHVVRGCHDSRRYHLRRVQREAEKKRQRNLSAEYKGKIEVIDISDTTSSSSNEASTLPIESIASSISHYRADKNTDKFSAVEEFLQTCDPPMDHLLGAFVEFGCTTAQYLRSMAAFSTDTRCRVLRRLLSRWSSGEVTEMDIAILDDHFIASFP